MRAGVPSGYLVPTVQRSLVELSPAGERTAKARFVAHRGRMLVGSLLLVVTLASNITAVEASQIDEETMNLVTTTVRETTEKRGAPSPVTLASDPHITSCVLPFGNDGRGDPSAAAKRNVLELRGRRHEVLQALKRYNVKNRIFDTRMFLASEAGVDIKLIGFNVTRLELDSVETTLWVQVPRYSGSGAGTAVRVVTRLAVSDDRILVVAHDEPLFVENDDVANLARRLGERFFEFETPAGDLGQATANAPEMAVGAVATATYLVLINAENPYVANDRSAEKIVRDLYLGQSGQWPDGSPAVAFARPAGHPAQQALVDCFLERTGGKASDGRRHSAEHMGASGPEVVPDARTLIRRIARAQGGIGLAAADEVDLLPAKVRVLFRFDASDVSVGPTAAERSSPREPPAEIRDLAWARRVIAYNQKDLFEKLSNYAARNSNVFQWASHVTPYHPAVVDSLSRFDLHRKEKDVYKVVVEAKAHTSGSGSDFNGFAAVHVRLVGDGINIIGHERITLDLANRTIRLPYEFVRQTASALSAGLSPSTRKLEAPSSKPIAIQDYLAGHPQKFLEKVIEYDANASPFNLILPTRNLNPAYHISRIMDYKIERQSGNDYWVWVLVSWITPHGDIFREIPSDATIIFRRCGNSFEIVGHGDTFLADASCAVSHEFTDNRIGTTVKDDNSLSIEFERARNLIAENGAVLIDRLAHDDARQSIVRWTLREGGWPDLVIVDDIVRFDMVRHTYDMYKLTLEVQGHRENNGFTQRGFTVLYVRVSNDNFTIVGLEESELDPYDPTIKLPYEFHKEATNRYEFLAQPTFSDYYKYRKDRLLNQIKGYNHRHNLVRWNSGSLTTIEQVSSFDIDGLSGYDVKSENGNLVTVKLEVNNSSGWTRDWITLRMLRIGSEFEIVGHE